MKFLSTKDYYNFPCSHRRWRHDGHCAHVHGYSRSFHLTFEASERNEVGFVLDFGGPAAKEIRRFLEETFDHTLLLDSDDPLLPRFRELEQLGACVLKTWDDVGMEGTAFMVYGKVSEILARHENGRVWCTRIEVRENNKNSGIFIP
ncbi:MAG: 6-carboxytetrahydropterin synthase [Bradymonadia bacterium]